ncbi:hypothetical protein FE257_011879 [Aspergillus nanangensis]|uniref:Roadblock/LAMTOR2 domain-containing protein n=1 Tax=Aspergillus nanangensis TaxID=2582783 RepID=A0AAD4CGV5_ASPNN|nr:hypothetical protein FE257_011879 [Aspergillus nanangensis]
MAHTTAVPQHVTALLSHLTSRPGVQSTFILSRKDGSIIQSTGLLALKPSANNVPPPPTSTSTQTPSPTETPPPTVPSTTDLPPPQPSSPSPPPTTTPQSTYQPSHAEALAAHVFAFVSSASDLSMSLSRPDNATASKTDSNRPAALPDAGLGNGIPREDGDADGSDREDDDEVKLLRLRTKKHEIVVVPDRKYLLCVVHDAAAGSAVGAGVRSSR